jgi:hypothetical protein
MNSDSSSLRSSPHSSSRSSTGSASRHVLASAATATIAIAFAASSIGCAKDPVVAPTGEPMVVLEATGRVRLAVPDGAGGWLDVGWRRAESLEGWTVIAYGWDDDR